LLFLFAFKQTIVFLPIVQKKQVIYFLSQIKKVKCKTTLQKFSLLFFKQKNKAAGQNQTGKKMKYTSRSQFF